DRLLARAPDQPRSAGPIGRHSLAVEVVGARRKLVARRAGCGAGLAHAPASWKTGAGVTRCMLGTAEYAERAGVWAPFRGTGPVVLREYVCPGCGRLLATEVVLDRAPQEDDVRPDSYVRAPGRALPAGPRSWYGKRTVRS